jgi:hypothetical protein
MELKMRYEVICHEKGCPGPKTKWADTEREARELGLKHELETGHRFTTMPEELNPPLRPLTGNES